MAKIARDPTETQLALLAAKHTVRTIRTKLDKKPTAELERDYIQALNALATAAENENRERFVNLGGLRVTNVLIALDRLECCASRRSYKFNASDVDKMLNAIESRLAELRDEFAHALANGKGFERNHTKKFTFEAP